MSGWRWSDWEHSQQRVRQPQVSRPTCLHVGRKRESAWLGIIWLLLFWVIGIGTGLCIGELLWQ